MILADLNIFPEIYIFLELSILSAKRMTEAFSDLSFCIRKKHLQPVFFSHIQVLVKEKIFRFRIIKPQKNSPENTGKTKIKNH